MTEENTQKKSFFQRFKKPSKQMFWAWIAYQTIKGSLTTMFIWLPLIWMWLGHGGHH